MLLEVGGTMATAGTIGAKARVTSDPLVEPAPAGLTRSGAVRLNAIDMLRGLVIAIMVLDHVRDFFNVPVAGFDPTDPLKSYPALYLTRWVTHLCAPTFVFLAGVSILFQKANGKSAAELSRFLLTRGAWLVLLECTVVSFGFNFGVGIVFLQVIWAIGMSMIAMALLSRASSAVVLAIGAAILLVYPAVVPLTAGATGGLAIIRTFAIAPGMIPGAPILAFYSVVPWLGVMCLGFGLGPIFRMAPTDRSRALLAIALALLAAFVLLRIIDGYGDPAPWVVEPTQGRTMLSFFNVSKYPPSPDFICVTLGISMLLFLALQHLQGPVARVLLNFGRTPLFTYVCHIYIAHGLALLAALAVGTPNATFNLVGRASRGEPPSGWGYSLVVVYLVWAFVIALLIPLSRWMDGIKRRRRNWWLSYI
jgi:uncharacterized membrane protein